MASSVVEHRTAPYRQCLRIGGHGMSTQLMRPSGSRAASWPWHAAGLVSAASFAALLFTPRTLPVFFALAAAQTTLWAAAASAAGRRPPPAAALWLWAIAARAGGLMFVPWLEDDWYRFLWDGFRFATAGTPYGAAPEAFFGNPDIPAAFQQILSGINNPHLPTIYGPTLEAVFLGAYWIEPAALWPLKLLLIGADLAVIALLGLYGNRRRQWLYAFCPLVVIETAFHAHPDIIGAALAFAAALAVMRHRRLLGAALLGLAFAAKFWALLLAPWLIRSRAAAAVLAGTIMALYAPFAVTGDAGLTALHAFARDWQFNAPLYQGLAVLMGAMPARVALGGSVLALWAAFAWHTRHASLARGEVVFGLVLALSPVVNPWYALWMLPFAAGSSLVTPWVAAAVLPLSYAHGLFVDDPSLVPYQVAPAALALEWGAIATALAFDLYKHSRLERR